MRNNLFTLAAAAIAICGTVVALMLMPANATSEASAVSFAVVGEGPGYLPVQYVNQAREIEPLLEQF
jgi:hypothetical protein